MNLHRYALRALAAPVYDPQAQAFPEGWHPINDLTAMLSVNIGQE